MILLKDNISSRAIDYTKRMSINFIGVRKSPEQKQQVYDPENFTFLSLTIKWRHDFEIEDYVDQQVSSSVDYAFSFQPKPIEPFKKYRIHEKKTAIGNCSVILILISLLIERH
jgi:cell surface protein SprA